MTTEYLLDQEVGHVLAALTMQNRLIVRVILHTGMRISDVLALKTSDLKPSGWYTEQKTGKRRRYGLPAPLLAAIKAQAGPVWAFPGRLSPLKQYGRTLSGLLGPLECLRTWAPTPRGRCMPWI